MNDSVFNKWYRTVYPPPDDPDKVQKLKEAWNAALKQAAKVPELNLFARNHIKQLMED